MRCVNISITHYNFPIGYEIGSLPVTTGACDPVILDRHAFTVISFAEEIISTLADKD